MKIYVKDLNPCKIQNKIHNISKHLRMVKKCYMIFSDDGIFEITNNHISKLNITKESSSVYNTRDYTFIIDESVTMYSITNYIPHTHVIQHIAFSTYKINANSKVRLVIEWNITKEPQLSFNDLPSDFYFEIDNEEKIDKEYIIKDINVFLSLLN